MPIAKLTDRAVILAAGPEAESLLQNIITPDLSALSAGEAMPGALLTPQGKVLFDFLISRTGDNGLRLECRRDVAQDFLKRLMLYKLRAKVELSVQEQDVTVSWGADLRETASAPDAVRDRRLPEDLHVFRAYGKADAGESDVEKWHQLRIAQGVAESGSDYALGDAFPHDILFDQNDGVGLKKGCYVGQEVVSRMHHRGTARRRLMIVHGEGPLPPTGSAVTADGRPIGALGTVSGEDALAIVRVDRAGEAVDAGAPVLAADVPITLRPPPYAKFTLAGSVQGEAG